MPYNLAPGAPRDRQGKRGYRKFFSKAKKGTRPYRQKVTSSPPLASVHACDSKLSTPPLFHGFDCDPVLPPMRVLSLFDGLSSALLILENLKINVEVYYSSEVDEKALAVQEMAFQGRVVPLGCVKALSPQVLDSLGPINLLIGGPPCEDLSLVNPDRRGLHGPGSSGLLFYNYAAVKDYLQAKADSSNLPFYWLMENTAHMEVATLRAMSKRLGCEPVVRCASDFLPVNRRRNLWGNIPGIVSKAVGGTKVPLSDVLSHGRYPNVDHVPTLTTSFSSQRSGPERKLPVMHGTKESPLYIVELEQLFGFPPHFTDGPNLSVTDRRRLLGKSFAIPVFMDVLKPLCSVFRKTCKSHFTYGPPDTSHDFMI